MKQYFTGPYHLWEPYSDARIPVHSIREMIKYLENRFPEWLGYPVVRFKVNAHNQSVYVYVKVKDRIERRFFGYTMDVGHNIQRGFYEKD